MRNPRMHSLALTQMNTALALNLAMMHASTRPFTSFADGRSSEAFILEDDFDRINELESGDITFTRSKGERSDKDTGHGW